MVSTITISEALKAGQPVIDVRTPDEFAKGHIPGAINIPLFSNEERSHVGTVYKRESRESAIELGYRYVTPRLSEYLSRAYEAAPDGKAIVHCWRGGMRSSSFAEYLSENGFREVKVVIGGYKSFRNYVLEEMATPLKMIILGGYTGSGKTQILKELKNSGEQVIDLEALAGHKGSAFGGIGQDEQPTTEQFGNDLYMELRNLVLDKPVWVEDESHNIGRVLIPTPFFYQMQKARLYFIDIPKEERVKHLVTEYAGYDKRLLAEALHKISKRLGGLRESMAIEHLDDGEYYEVAMITLEYYDKYYLLGIAKRDDKSIIRIPLASTAHKENALKILNTVKRDE